MTIVMKIDTKDKKLGSPFIQSFSVLLGLIRLKGQSQLQEKFERLKRDYSRQRSQWQKSIKGTGGGPAIDPKNLPLIFNL